MTRRLKASINKSKEVLQKFGENLAGDQQAYHMKWSGSAFDAAARIYVHTEVLDMVNPESSYGAQDALKECTERALRMTCNPSHSTSPTSNLLDQHIAAAWASCAQALDQLIRYQPKEQA